MIEQFISLVEQTDVSIAVIGDCMLDEYYQVKVERISPEAPVPVFLTENHNADVHLPGGAGNVCYQLRAWPVDYQLYGIMDEKSQKYYDEYRIHTNRCPLLTASRIPIKRRYMSGDVQVARLDIESEWYGTGMMPLAVRQQKIADSFEKDPAPDVVILSDYGKGVFANGFPGKCIALCTGTNTTIIVDPKDGPLEQWYGCHIFKPNSKEATKLSGLEDPQDQADFFMEKLNCEAVVITHSGEGVTGKIKDKHFEYLTPSSHSTMKDVAIRSACGAGDCFAAFLAMAVGVKIPVDEAAKIAFEAGAIYVTHRHNEPVQTWEMLAIENPTKAKIRKVSEMPQLSQDTVFTNGCFDLLHPGHIETLRFARSKGSCLVVGLNSDTSVKRLKGPNRPVMSQDQRATMLAALEFVDYVVVFDDDTPLELIKALKPSVLVKGDEYDASKIVGADVVEQVYTAPMVEGFSTSSLIQKVKGQ